MDKNEVQINKKLIQHLSGLARLDFDGDEEQRILNSFSDIVEYFDELQGVDVEGVEPVGGGNDLVNVVREDEYDEDDKLSAQGPVNALPQKDKDGYNKIPPVFTNDN